jgi:hypothetical protein
LTSSKPCSTTTNARSSNCRCADRRALLAGHRQSRALAKAHAINANLRRRNDEQLAPAIRRIKRRTGRTPCTVVTDRGYGEQRLEDELSAEVVRTPSAAPQGPTERGTAPDRSPPSVPATRPMARRKRRTDQLPQTRLRAQPHTHRRQRRRPCLVRSQRAQPQPRQVRDLVE